MALVIVERSFEEPQVFDDLQAAESAVAWCLEQNSVTFLRSYFAVDRKRMICLYEAPDAEAVRRTQKEGGLSYTRIYSVDTIEGETP